MKDESDPDVSANEMSEGSAVWAGSDDSIPWGDGPDVSVRQYLDRMKTDRIDAERVADNERRQGKLFEARA